MQEKKVKVFLKPGEVFISREPAVVSTILGSCVAITIFNERLKVGGICHALLPGSPSLQGADYCRYVDSSITYMLKKLEAMGIQRHEMEIKLLGGADVLNIMDVTRPSVGQQNIEKALEIMNTEKLALTLSDVGGKTGRNIRFYTHTGTVLLKRIQRMPN
ncbi:MAG: chemotaxis protein CheD [Syntrophus sp. (in: bacteria)]|nr:chemotaxis protein CheD [Syntrophus sp. (in: bacteria)]